MLTLKSEEKFKVPPPAISLPTYLSTFRYWWETQIEHLPIPFLTGCYQQWSNITHYYQRKNVSQTIGNKFVVSASMSFCPNCWHLQYFAPKNNEAQLGKGNFQMWWGADANGLQGAMTEKGLWLVKWLVWEHFWWTEMHTFHFDINSQDSL